MAFPSLLIRVHPPCSAASARSWIASFSSARKYATRINPNSSLLSQSLDQNSKQDKGPFQLGLGLGQPAVQTGEKIPKWSELSTAGKVKRTTARTTNLTVILVGAGLSAVLIYCLTSELFSKNSPSVLYDDACERIKASPRLAKYLDGPPRFHLDPPAAARPRHRNRHVSSSIRVDTSGREHMFLNFYIQTEPPKASFAESLSGWTQDKFSFLTEMTLDDLKARAQESASVAWDRSKEAFKFLSGAPSPPSPTDAWPADARDADRKTETRGGFMGMFSSLRGPRTSVESRPEVDGRVFSEGEVHVNFVKNNEGNFIPRYIIVDLPNSRARNSVRVFVERAAGVRDSEPVMRWNS
ncbi:TIM21-domain-containing protein [Mycena rosella]|uniref:Mitochondrial import inner membrane translocase subunit Tim21 n=1 Tax=Mycena rosella TaxID=1033263 RepID=A0AAD7DKD4_MYCRO|nr:TIM21-domain-containing protein [Mycena rosella]